jgi:serine/threonine-protein kinase
MLAGRYRIFGLLGRGGMGEVYRADDVKLGQPVALKFLPPGLERDASRLERFLAEVRTARQVTHPNVCRVYDVVEADGQHFLSMEYVDGEDLGALLLRIGRLPHDKAVEIARQLCAGVHAAHEQGILHRDLKPANVMIDGRGRVRITDFGLAGLEDAIDADDVRSGTPAYMAPEQLRGEEVTVRSDVYSLGLVLNELFTGRHAFEGRRDPRLRSPDERPTAPSSRLENLDPVVERVILRCLEADPAKRPGSALEVSAGLPGGDPLAAALAAGETPSPELVAEAGKRDALRPAVALALGVAALTLFVVTSRWAGTQSILHFLPLEKPPEVLVDRAQGILADLGYTEPVYSDPVDQAWGLYSWGSVLDQVRERVDEGGSWTMLRDRPDALTFWYRQAPQVLLPIPVDAGPSFLRGGVELWNPTFETAGEAMISLDLEGRLRRLEVRPKRLSTREPEEPDWAPLFALADLDPARFHEERPRYQRFFVPDQRRAWVGTREDQPEVELRVEAGSFEGRACLFDVATTAAIAGLAEDPTPRRRSGADQLLRSLEPIFLLGIVLGGILLARRHRKEDRADRRAAARVATFIGVCVFVSAALGSHALFTPAWVWEIWPLVVFGGVIGALMWVLFLAAEPIGRRVWPTMFISMSRLLSRDRIGWREPLIGRTALIALFAGPVIFLLSWPLPRLLEVALTGQAAEPGLYEWFALLGQRQAASSLVGSVLAGAVSLLFVVLLILLRVLLKRTTPAIAIAVLVWPLIWNGSELSPAVYVVGVLAAGLEAAVLLRGGALALLLGFLVARWTFYATVPDWSAWYGQAAVMAVAAATLLAIYGVWASIGGKRPVRPDGGAERP